jgi:hypothetical protein
VAELWDVIEGLNLTGDWEFNRIDMCVDLAADINNI